MTGIAHMQGRVCLITGASAGIGHATAHDLAKMGATVFLVARDEKRGGAALSAIRQATGNEQLRLLIADLSSLAQVRSLAEEVRREAPALHVLINNAATIPKERRLTVDGLETQLVVNHLAPFLLTNLLLDLLRDGGPARIINVASQTHAGATIPFDDLQSEREYHPSSVYAWTKLANILFTYELARRLAGQPVTVNALNPGVVNTNLLQDYMGSPRDNGRRINRYGMSPEKGAETPVYLASADDVQDISGRYFRDRRPVSSSQASYDGALARRLWDVSARLVGLN